MVSLINKILILFKLSHHESDVRGNIKCTLNSTYSWEYRIKFIFNFFLVSTQMKKFYFDKLLQFTYCSEILNRVIKAFKLNAYGSSGININSYNNIFRSIICYGYYL